MRLELERAWHKEKQIMYNRIKIDQLIPGRGQFYRCYTDQGSEEIHELLLDLLYNTMLTDDDGVSIITGDIIRIKMTNETKAYDHKVFWANKEYNPYNTIPVIDLLPPITTPSLGIGYLLSSNIESIKVVGDIYNYRKLNNE